MNDGIPFDSEFKKSHYYSYTCTHIEGFHKKDCEWQSGQSSEYQSLILPIFIEAYINQVILYNFHKISKHACIYLLNADMLSGWLWDLITFWKTYINLRTHVNLGMYVNLGKYVNVGVRKSTYLYRGVCMLYNACI